MDEMVPVLQVGSAAPTFSEQAVVGSGFETLKFDSGTLTIGDKKITGKYTVLFFYPLDFTFVSPTEIIAFNDKLADFEKAGASVIGISIDSHFSHLAWKNRPRNEGGLGDIDFPLLSDMSKQIAYDYGVLLEEGTAARGVFIIDEKGILQSYTVNNIGVGQNINEVIRLIEGFKFVAENSEVCPANWTPGADTIKPDPEGSKDYFKRQ
jgi:alkyl hydroperoxide reductase subunit AhpC